METRKKEELKRAIYLPNIQDLDFHHNQEYKNRLAGDLRQNIERLFHSRMGCDTFGWYRFHSSNIHCLWYIQVELAQ